MELRRIHLYHLLFAAALLLALGLRLWELGAAPLTDAEARLALNALQVAHGQAVLDPGYTPGYVALTSMVFALFSSTNFLARFWPALAGSLLVLVPAFFISGSNRRRLPALSVPAAVLLSFGLALDPGLVTISRQADGAMMALSFSLLALGAWNRNNPLWGGLFAGLALLSGPGFFYGLLIAALVVLLWRPVRRRLAPASELSTPQPEGPPPALQQTLIVAGVSALLVGALFLRYPQGLAALFNSLGVFLTGWIHYGGIPALRPLAALLVYAPFTLLFSFLAAGRLVSGDYVPYFLRRPAGLLALWVLAALLLVLIYPARQVSDLIWALLPLWGLTALELSQHLPNQEQKFEPIALAEAAAIVILLGLAWFNLAAYVRTGLGVTSVALRLGVIAGIFSLIGLLSVLIGLGWSWTTGRMGLIWGLAAASGLYLISVLWGAAYLRPHMPQELWSNPPATGQAGLLLESLHELSSWNTGFPTELDLVVTVDAPSLHWALRDFENARFVSEAPLGERPAAVITYQNANAPALTDAYRGQDFVWQVLPGWNGALPPGISRWFTFREAPLAEEMIILWARSDIIPGGAEQPSAASE